MAREHECGRCRGKGWVTRQECDLPVPPWRTGSIMTLRERTALCPDCHGTGRRQ